MGLLSNIAETFINPNNIPFLEGKGYILTKEIIDKNGNIKTKYRINEKIIVKIKDLSPNSNVLIDVQCDFCGKILQTKYQNYRIEMEKYGNYYCKHCAYNHAILTNRDKYNVDYVMQCSDIKEKARQAELERTEEENKVILEKRKATSKLHFDTDYPMQSNIVKEKKIQTTRERYNVDHYAQNPECFAKIKLHNIEKYGVEFISQVPEVKEKLVNTLYANGLVATSNPQIYIYNLYKRFYPNAILNKKIRYYFGDIAIDNIIIEVDFGGHDLSVKIGSITQKEFERKQIIRAKTLKNEGYKTIRIISTIHNRYNTPSDEILLEILEQSKQYFKDYPNHSWREWDIDNGIFQDAEHKDGESYDYGLLRKIK